MEISQIVLTIVLGLLSLMVIGLLSVVLVQRKEIVELKKPKFGFLGKPVYSFAILLTLTGIAGAVYFYSPGDSGQDIDVDTKKEFLVTIEKNVHGEVENGLIDLTLNAVPIIKGQKWGDPMGEYKVYWEILDEINEKQSVFYEARITYDNPGGVDLKLQPGKYKAEIVMESKAFQTKFSMEFTVE